MHSATDAIRSKERELFRQQIIGLESVDRMLRGSKSRERNLDRL